MPISMSGSPPKPPSASKEPVVVPGAPRWPGRDHDEFKRERAPARLWPSVEEESLGLRARPAPLASAAH